MGAIARREEVNGHTRCGITSIASRNQTCNFGCLLGEQYASGAQAVIGTRILSGFSVRFDRVFEASMCTWTIAQLSRALKVAVATSLLTRQVKPTVQRSSGPDPGTLHHISKPSTSLLDAKTASPELAGSALS